MSQEEKTPRKKRTFKLLIMAGPALSLIIAISFSSCRVFDSKGSFVGIDSLYGHHGYTNVFMMHGMGIKPKTDGFDYAMQTIATELEFNDKEPPTIYPIDGGARGNIKVQIFKKNGHDLRFFYIHWSPITLPFKTWLARVDSNSKRQFINGALKKLVVTEGFSDITSYADREIRRDIHFLMAKALQLAHVETSILMDQSQSLDQAIATVSYDTTHHHESLIMISGSFGSKIMNDVLKNMPLNENFDSDPAALILAQNVLHHKVQWYVLSNQLPLLDVFDFSRPLPIDTITTDSVLEANVRKLQVDSGTYGDATRELLRMYDNESQHDWIKRYKLYIASRQTLICFNDPNDLLGYKVPKRTFQGESRGDSVVDVQLSNAKRYLIVSRPDKAHTEAVNNDRLLKLIARGCASAGKCK